MWFYDQTFFSPAPRLDVQVFLAGIRTQNVLNLFFITLDGPNLTFDIKQE